MNKLNLKGTRGVRSSTKANAPFYSFRGSFPTPSPPVSINMKCLPVHPITHKHSYTGF